MADEDEIITIVEGEGAASGAKTEPESDAVAALKAQFEESERRKDAELAAERRRANDAARAADTARREATAAHSQIAESQLDTVASGLAAAQSEAASAEAEYASCMEKGDFIAAAKAQRRIASAEAKIVRLDEAKADLEARKAAPRPELPQPQQRSGDVFEDHVSRFTQPTADWMRAHREWVEDPRKSKKLSAAHFDAEAEGLVADTPAYFAHVETYLGLRQKPNGNGAASNGSARPAPRPAAPVAPVNGGNGSASVGSNGGGQEVRLSAGEVAAANDGATHVWGKHDLAAGRIKDASLIGRAIGTQEFARRKLAMMKQGRYDKSYTES